MISARKSFFAIAFMVASLCSLLTTAVRGDIPDHVLAKTYTLDAMSPFSFAVEAFHHDDHNIGTSEEPAFGFSNLWVTLNIIVRDPLGQVCASADMQAQLSGGAMRHIGIA